MKTRNKTVLAGLTAFAALATGQASAEILFADSFNRADSTNLNASATGKSGSLAPLDWIEQNLTGDPDISGNTLRLGEDGGGAGWSIAYVDHNFIDSLITTGGEFTVSVDISGLSPTGNTRFNGFALGHSKTEVDNWSANTPAAFDSDFFFGLDTTNPSTTGFYTYENGTENLVDSTVPAGGASALSVRFTGVTDFNLGTTVSYQAFIDGVSADTGTFTWSGTNENYIALYSNFPSNSGVADNTAILDNFEVSAVPEPSSLALLGLGGLCMLKRRRRN